MVFIYVMLFKWAVLSIFFWQQCVQQDLSSVFPQNSQFAQEEVVEIPTCKAQGIIKIPNAKDPPVPRSSADQKEWPICREFQGCSCCNTSHVVALNKQRWQKYPEYNTLSKDCNKFFELSVCKSCDPNVGVSASMDMCLSHCEEWFNACKADFFTYDQVSQKLRPCNDEPNTMMCAKAQDLVKGGKEFCYSLGQAYALADTSCYKGVGDEALCKYVLELEKEAAELAIIQEREAMRAAIKIALTAIGVMIASIILFPPMPGGRLGTRTSVPSASLERKDQ
eukprot:TRINITY_DN3576_c0_g1_i7.p1 TRINITY_DN3576_c0_g1~~TRINITY_DN3576_c0_g1_i7.p1  ORF type:complete len:300 (+),score=24.96 TRINITY_DN3576_c0_g1_i7:61-900(+)